MPRTASKSHKKSRSKSPKYKSSPRSSKRSSRSRSGSKSSSRKSSSRSRALEEFARVSPRCGVSRGLIIGRDPASAMASSYLRHMQSSAGRAAAVGWADKARARRTKKVRSPSPIRQFASGGCSATAAAIVRKIAARQGINTRAPSKSVLCEQLKQYYL